MREGPFVIINRSCHGCAYHDQERYRVQGDSGYSHYCQHSSFEKKRYIDDTANTPKWCPFSGTETWYPKEEK